jgi:cyclomaltodextrinase / maltogenic alpha-amylase / neopullulanase
MGWIASVIWWHCYPLGFVDAEPRIAEVPAGKIRHRLDQLTGWFDYLIELGANGLMLAPVFASTSHGYDTLDHFRIDPRLGDLADFDALVREAQGRGIRICLDGVFNHVSQDHEIVQRALAEGPESEAGRWVTWDNGYTIGFEGNLDLVELNLAHPPVVDYIVEVMCFWLDRGADGWRLDAAFPAGGAAWRPVIDRVKAAHPDAWIVAELINGGYTEFVAESNVDSVTQYELWKAIWSSLNDHNLHELAWALSRHADFSARFRSQTFLGNHDQTRIATLVEDPRNLPLAIAVLLLVPGIPTIYAGDEQAFTGQKLDQPGGDNAVRPPFPRSPAELLPFGAETLRVYKELVGVRRDHPWLVDATLTVSDVTNTTMTIHLATGTDHLALALNAGDETATSGDLSLRAHSYVIAH